MGYITVSEAAKKWGISDRRVRLLCSQDRIEGVIHKGRKYLIPIDAKKPVDERTRKSKANPAENVNVFEKSDLLKEELQKKAPLPRKVLKEIDESFIQEYCYNSNAIDGNSLNLKEIISVLEGNTVARKPLKDHLDAVGLKDAYQYVVEMVDSKIPLSENTLKQIHSLVLIGSAKTKGRYRTCSLKVKDPYIEPVPPYMIKSKMNDLIFENNRRRKMMHPLERIARFHMDFKGIHPFSDGNGRTNRLILNLELMQEGYPPIDIKFSDRKRYFEAFDSYFKDGDPKDMIDILVKYVEEAMEKILAMENNSMQQDAENDLLSKEIILSGSMMHNNPVRFEQFVK